MLLLLKDVFRRYPIHVLLLPVFFICTKFIQYQGLLETKVVLNAGLIIASIIAGFFLLNFIFLKDLLKSAFAATCCGFVFLFFGDFREFLQTSSVYFISTYKFYLPLLALLLVIMVFTLRKAENTGKMTVFLNLLLFIYTISEVPKLIKLNINNNQAKRENVHFVPVSDSLKKTFPDIYYIVPDCYPSSSYQKEMLNTSNSFFDNA